MDKETMTLEERFEKIEQILRQMDSSDVHLDESFELYKAGVEEIRQANAMLEHIEKSMLVMNDKGELEEF